MSLIRARQRPITAINPHDRNRRYLVPNRRNSTPPAEATDLQDSDGWLILTPASLDVTNYGYNAASVGTVQPALWSVDKDPGAGVAYLGSFGENFFNLRFTADLVGAPGTQTHRPVGSPDTISVSITKVGTASFAWDGGALRYAGNWPGLAASLAVLVGEEILCRLGPVK